MKEGVDTPLSFYQSHGLSCGKCDASDEASHLLNEIDIPGFQTNTLILGFL